MEVKNSDLELEKEEIINNQISSLFYCFRIEDEAEIEIWKICNHNELIEYRGQRIIEFRNNLIKKIIQYIENKFGLDIDENIIIKSNNQEIINQDG